MVSFSLMKSRMLWIWVLSYPSFFSAEVTANQLNLRVQRGSDFESYADGLVIHVRDVNEVDETRLGLPIPLAYDEDGEAGLVSAILYLNESCYSGFPAEHRRRPLIMPATSGSIVFSAIYSPDRDAAATAIEAELVDVQFIDRETPEERNATLSGEFSLFYQRGSPAQRFP